MVARTGPPATRNCEPRQARKGAAAAVDVGAGVWLVWVTSIFVPPPQESAGAGIARLRENPVGRNCRASSLHGTTIGPE